MGLVKNISIIGLVAALSFYGTEAAVNAFTKPATGETAAAGKVTTGVASGTTTVTAAVMILDDTVTADGTIATVTATSDASGTVTYATTTTLTIFAIDSTTGVITVSGTNPASLSDSPYTFVVEATDDAGGAKGTLTITLTVNGVPSFTDPATCWYIADEAPTATTLGTYTASSDSGETFTYSIASGGNTGTAFTTPMVGGKLVTASKMAKATTPKYTLVLYAVDSASFPGTGSTTVTVSVQDAGTTTQACGTAGLLGSLLVVMAVLVAQFM